MMDVLFFDAFESNQACVLEEKVLVSDSHLVVGVIFELKIGRDVGERIGAGLVVNIHVEESN